MKRQLCRIIEFGVVLKFLLRCFALGVDAEDVRVLHAASNGSRRTSDRNQAEDVTYGRCQLRVGDLEQ